MVPHPYDEGTAIDWTPVWSLTHGRHRYVPTSYCYMHPPGLPADQVAHFNSNGNAAGNCIEEAILQGFLELVERDAVAIWWYNRLRRPRVDLRSFGEPYFTRLVDHYESMGVRVWVLDLTHDLDIPAFCAVARSPTAPWFWLGCGCHFEARLGVQRALTELNQGFEPEGQSIAAWREGDFEDTRYLFPDDAAPARARGAFAEIRRDDLRDDVLDCVERAARAGLEALVLDQTRPDVGLKAVKVIVPGLRHFWARLGPGRLYDVPVRLGWLDRPLDESQMNRVPFHL
jgi:ribosomal protein S12 methylthiotransferase accessory factor